MNQFNVTSGSQDATDLFPLPLSPFERYMLLDDSDAYPMSFALKITVKGDLRKEPFEQSVHFALKRHPLLISNVVHVRGMGQCWVPVVTSPPAIDWCAAGQPARNRNHSRINLKRETGVRLYVDHRSDSADVLFEFHHACTDGLGGVQFIGDILARYAQLTAPADAEAPQFEDVKFDRLRSRTNFSMAEGESASKSVSCPYMLMGRLWKLLRRRPVPLAATRRTCQGSTLEFPAMISRIIEKSDLQQLKVVAARKSIELNDLYMSEMFLTIRDWNRDHGRGRARQWLRIAMPTSLRTPLHDQMPAANVVSYMFLTRRAEECDRPDELLAGIHRQTSKVVNQRLGQFAAIMMNYLQKIPGLTWCLLRLNPCFCTAVLANVGEIRRGFNVRLPLKQGQCVAGNVVLDGVMGSPPVRPNTRLSTSLGTYGGRLFINLHCDPLSYSKEQAEELADRFVNRLRCLSSALQHESKAAS